MTAIEWTDRTWNPVVGCTKVSAGCKNCYAKTEWDRRHKGHLAGKKVAPQYAQPFEVVQLMPERLSAPLGWRKPEMVFVNSVSDLFHEDVPFDYIDRVFAVMALTPQHTYQVLTKRPARMREYLTADRHGMPTEAHIETAKDILSTEKWGLGQFLGTWPLPNVWLGVSVEDQEAADERIPILLDTPAAVRFLSCEPLLGPVTLDLDICEGCDAGDGRGHRTPIRWVIAGGESGPGARSMDLAWIRAVVNQCQAAAVPVFVKQLGASAKDGEWELMMRSPKGGDMGEWPADLRVRQFPEVRRAS